MDHPHLKRDVPDQTQFNRILQNIDGISPKVLTQRMKTLQRLEIVERRIVLASPIHIEYRLTDLEGVLEPALLFAANHTQWDLCRLLFLKTKSQGHLKNSLDN